MKDMGYIQWGQKRWIVNYWLKRMKTPFEEPYSIRQVFYKELPEIMAVVPERVKENTKNWASEFYNSMTHYLSDLVLDGRASYRTINIFDDSGASEWIWQNINLIVPLTEEMGFAEYPIEVWVENNATYNSVKSLFEQDGEFQINILSTRGPAKTQQIEKLKRYRSNDVKVILNLTDFDPSGYDMSRDLSSRCRQIGLDVEVERIGILPDQLPEERRKVSLIRYAQRDPNLMKFLKAFPDEPMVLLGYGYEIQALEPREIRQLVREHVNMTIDHYGFEKKE